MKPDISPTEYLDGIQVRTRYGRRSPMWLHRVQAEPDFPKPITIRNRNYWRLADLEAYEETKRAVE